VSLEALAKGEGPKNKGSGREIIIQDTSSNEGKGPKVNIKQPMKAEEPLIDEVKRQDSPKKQEAQVALKIKKDFKDPVPKISQSTIKSYNIDSFSLDDYDDIGPSNR